MTALSRTLGVVSLLLACGAVLVPVLDIALLAAQRPALPAPPLVLAGAQAALGVALGVTGLVVRRRPATALAILGTMVNSVLLVAVIGTGVLSVAA